MQEPRKIIVFNLIKSLPKNLLFCVYVGKPISLSLLLLLLQFLMCFLEHIEVRRRLQRSADVKKIATHLLLIQKSHTKNLTHPFCNILKSKNEILTTKNAIHNSLVFSQLSLELHHRMQFTVHQFSPNSPWNFTTECNSQFTSFLPTLLGTSPQNAIHNSPVFSQLSLELHHRMLFTIHQFSPNSPFFLSQKFSSSL